MWAYVHIHVAIRAHICRDVCTYMWAYAHIHVAISAHICRDMCTYVGICVDICTRPTPPFEVKINLKYHNPTVQLIMVTARSKNVNTTRTDSISNNYIRTLIGAVGLDELNNIVVRNPGSVQSDLHPAGPWGLM